MDIITNITDIPIVSVIITTYNRADLVGRAINSVLSQTFRGFELIVVNDASKDNTEEVVKGYNDERMRYIRHTENKGVSAARNSGIKASMGKYVSFLDDDDEWLPEKLQRQTAKFNSSIEGVGLIYTWHCDILNGENIRSHCSCFNGNLYDTILRIPIFSNTTLIKRECFDEVGLFDEALPAHEDWDMYIRILKYYEVDFVPEVLVRINIDGISHLSRNIEKNINGMLQIIKKHGVDFNERPSALSKYLRRIGVLYSLNNKPRTAAKYFIRSIIVKPTNWVCYAHLFLLWTYRKKHNELLNKYLLKKQT